MIRLYCASDSFKLQHDVSRLNWPIFIKMDLKTKKKNQTPGFVLFFTGKRRKKTLWGKNRHQLPTVFFLVSPRVNLYFTPSESVEKKVSRLITVVKLIPGPLFARALLIQTWYPWIHRDFVNTFELKFLFFWQGAMRYIWRTFKI